jgi:hypothetical protein
LSKSSKSTPLNVNNAFFCGLAFSVKLLELTEWLESPLYDPVINCCPDAVGVKDTVQEAMFWPLPPERVHVPELLNVPELFVVKVTVPVGTVGLDDVSVTLAVHWVTVWTTTDPGTQLTLVLVECAPVTDVTVMLMLLDAVFALASVTVTLTVSVAAEVNVVENVAEVAVEFTAPLTDHAKL